MGNIFRFLFGLWAKPGSYELDGRGPTRPQPMVHVLEPRPLEMSTVQEPGLVSGNFRLVAKTSFNLNAVLMGDRAKLGLVGE